MKIPFFPILLFAVCYSTSAVAQGTDGAPPPLPDAPPAKGEKVYEMFDIQEQPGYPNGMEALYKFIADNLHYPELARENAITGTVVLTFVIDKDGAVTEPVILKDIGGGCGKEALRVVQAMPKWKPGMANGMPVKVRYTLPVRFRLEDDWQPSAPPPLPASGEEMELPPLAAEGMWELVLEQAVKVGLAPKDAPKSHPFTLKTLKDKSFLMTFEIAFKTKFSDAESKGFKTLGEISDYVHRSQFAPVFYTRSEFGGRALHIPTNRANFDLNSDGLGKTGSLEVPKGAKVTLYSAREFKGKKLEINASNGDVSIPDLSAVKEEKGVIKNKGKNVNWGVGVKSVKVEMGTID